MGAQLRVYTQRIKSAQTTKKITKAMELVAAAKLRRAEARIEALRPYAERMRELMIGTARATPATVTEASGAVGAARASLRAAHLRYHLETREALTPEQIGRYAELRGYTAARR